MLPQIPWQRMNQPSKEDIKKKKRKN